jgi:hypothetical protein
VIPTQVPRAEVQGARVALKMSFPLPGAGAAQSPRGTGVNILTFFGDKSMDLKFRRIIDMMAFLSQYSLLFCVI